MFKRWIRFGSNKVRWQFMRANIEARLLTTSFFGPMEEIKTGSYTKSLPYPTIYTFAGSIITHIITSKGISDQLIKEFQNKIKEEKINFYGIYFKLKDNYYIPISYQLVELTDTKAKKIRMPNLQEKLNQVNDESFLPVSRFNLNYKFAERSKLYLLGLDQLSNIQNADVRELELRSEERTRIRIERNSRNVIEGALFTLSYINYEDERLEHKSICVDLESEEELEINDYIGNLGGEFTLAEFKVNRSIHPLLDRIKETPKESNTFLAVSHIPIALKNGKLICRFGEIVAILGNVDYIGGWDYYEAKLKKMYAAILPGSLFIVRNKIEKFRDEKWYFNLLKTAIPI